jgi:hypothetical protein
VAVDAAHPDVVAVSLGVQKNLLRLRRWASYDELLANAREFFADLPAWTVSRGVFHAVTEARRLAPEDERIGTLWRQSIERDQEGDAT